ncbi:hypothetical protein SAMN05660226_02303 [Parapedobacter luteus]|uniref:Uncharacterized protein n=1 Tax=Parapedobacter luteus TaxID=623280 RepID=A0A1T5CSQ0_9SPHI|nr:hypothetical protein SAMN05660226_02303 [Parapedobacter luteus]
MLKATSFFKEERDPFYKRGEAALGHPLRISSKVPVSNIPTIRVKYKPYKNPSMYVALLASSTFAQRIRLVLRSLIVSIVKKVIQFSMIYHFRYNQPL